MVENDEGEGSTSRISTLGEELQYGRKSFASMCQPPLQESTILHPLYISTRQQGPVKREVFGNHLRKIRSSLKTYREQSLFGEDETQHASTSSGHTPEKVKRQKIFTLLREASSHCSATINARNDLFSISGETGKADVSLREAVDKCFKSITKSRAQALEDQSEAENLIELLVQACEYMAKGLGLETFAEVHQRDKSKVYALTLAASILVVDVEIELAADATTNSKPAAHLRLSYATDSSTASTQSRDPRLAESLRIDLQEVVDLVFTSLHPSAVDHTDIEARDTFAQLEKKLAELKRLDDASQKLHKSEGAPSTTTDLFAALDALCASLESADTTDEGGMRRSEVGLGKVLMHLGSPYATIIYHTNQDLHSVSDDNKIVSLLNDIPSKSQQQYAYSLHITIRDSTIGMSPASKDIELPSLGPHLRYIAILNRSMPMSRWMANRLSEAVGIAKTRDGGGKTQMTNRRAEYITANKNFIIASFERLLAERSDHSEDSLENLYFSSSDVLPKERKRQGVLVSEFAFASVNHLRKGIEILRQQAKLNEMLSCVALKRGATEGEGGVDRGVGLKCSSKYVNLVSVKYICDDPTILVSCPLSSKQCILEIRMTSLEKQSWKLDASIISLLNPTGKHIRLDKEDDLYRLCVAELTEEGASTLASIVTRLREWARRALQSEGHAMALDDQLAIQGESDNVAKKSTMRVAEENLDATNDIERKSSAKSASIDNMVSDRVPNTKRRASQAGIDAEADANDAQRGNRRKI